MDSRCAGVQCSARYVNAGWFLMTNKPQSPTPAEILAIRQAAGLTQEQAAFRVYATSYRTWQDWERGVRQMPVAIWKLWQAQEKYPTLIKS